MKDQYTPERPRRLDVQGRTTTAYLRPEERRVIEAAARVRGIGVSRYLRVAAVERAREELGLR